MTEEKIKRMLDACFLAKRIRDFLPELPDGVKPAYIQFTNCREMECRGSRFLT